MAGDASVVMVLSAVFDALVATFGPFLIPATLFVLGAIGYLFLYLVTRARRESYADDRL